MVHINPVRQVLLHYFLQLILMTLNLQFLYCNVMVYITDQEKAQKLNSSLMCQPFPPSTLPTSRPFYADQQLLEVFYCTVYEVEHALQCLISSKASGPDKYLQRYLNMLLLVLHLQNCSKAIRSGRLPDEWKTSMIVPIPKFHKIESY